MALEPGVPLDVEIVRAWPQRHERIVVRLADGQWRSLLGYRLLEWKENTHFIPPGPRTGGYLDEILSFGPAYCEPQTDDRPYVYVAGPALVIVGDAHGKWACRLPIEAATE